MRKFTKSLVFAILASAAIPAAPLMAMQGDATDGMSAEQQSSFMTWPDETKTYYSSLSQDHQAIFWALSDDDKVTLSRMEPEQRDDIMRQLEARVSGAAPEGR
ncbi:MAG: hypothetical protein ACXIT4_09410 [Erythrobacter sp.]